MNRYDLKPFLLLSLSIICCFSAFGGDVNSMDGAIEVTYDLPADGEVTLGIYDGSKLLNTILKNEFRDKGENSEDWNGLDHWGEPVAPGDYQVKGIYHPHIMTEHVMSFGNPGNPPWPTASNTGDWLSDEASPQAAVTDGNLVFLAAPGSEKGYAIIAVDESGQRVWGTKQSFYPRTVSLALEGDYLYALFSGPERTTSSRKYYPGDTSVRNRAILVCLDKRTGKAAKFTRETPRLKIATWPYSGKTTGLWELRTNMSFSPDNYTGQPRYFAEDIGEATSAIGIAALDNKLYVAMREENKILVLNADTGAQIDEISIHKPAGLHALSKHEILAISDQQVVKINTVSQQSVSVIEHGLLAPRCVTTDAQNQIYVSDWGSSFQVKVFAPDGTPLRSIGKAGGRPWMGKWDTSGMLVPTGIAVTDTGKLWVAEDDSSPKRISVWNAETGAFLKEFIGPTPYGGGGALIDPIDPTVAYSQGLRLKLDMEAKTWDIESSVGRRMDVNQPFAYQGHAIFSNRKLVRRNGQEYLIQSGRANITIFQRKGDLYLPVAAQGGFRIDLVRNASQKHIWDSDIGYHIVDDWYPAFFKEHLGENYTWTDLNGDNLVQPEEMQWAKALGTGDAYVAGEQMIAMGFWGGSVANDWSIYWPGSCLDANGVYRLDVKGWTDVGAPIYAIEDSVVIAAREDSFYSLYVSSDDNIFINYAWERNKGGAIIECLNRDGDSLWAIPFSKEHGIKDIHSNNILNEFTIPGLGSVLGTWAWHGNYMSHLITADGLYVSSLLESGQRVGPYAAWDESFKAYYQGPDGVPYIINGANDSHHILEIKGLEGGRFEAALQLTAEDVAQAAQIAELPVERAAPEPIIMVGSSGQIPVIDGELDEWNLRSGVRLEGDKERSARIALQRDDQNLYLAYEVSKDSPFSNQGNDWQALFITGDCVDLMLANRRKVDPHRPAAVEGDQRLLITEYQGEPIAVLYRPVVPGSTEPTQLMAARIDEITRLDSANIRIQSEGNRYNVEASIPLKDLGLDPHYSDTLQGDVGVIFSDEMGSSRSQRLYYYNKKTGITADLTTEATLQPAEWGTIQFPLGLNLLKNNGFNSGFADQPEDGWFINVEKNGGRVLIVKEVPRSGASTLILEQTEPVIYPPESYSFPDHRDFVAAGNHGTGGGRAGVTQTVPVTAGKYYSLRVNFRAEGLKPEIKKPDPKRGYSQFVVDLNWQRPGYTNEDKQSFLRSVMTKKDSHEWNQITNLRFNHYGVPTPYQAPKGATAVTISLRLETNAADNLPTVWVDDVEFVEVEMMHQQSPSEPQE
jgi:RES domain-containing protein